RKRANLPTLRVGRRLSTPQTAPPAARGSPHREPSPPLALADGAFGDGPPQVPVQRLLPKAPGDAPARANPLPLARWRAGGSLRVKRVLPALAAAPRAALRPTA